MSGDDADNKKPDAGSGREPDGNLQTRTFAAMGCEVELTLELADPVVGDAALASAEELVHRLAALLTRFDDDSQLQQLARARSLRCSPDLVEVLQLALDARVDTGGRFDPTLGRTMRAIGYDRTFLQLDAVDAAVAIDAAQAVPRETATPGRPTAQEDVTIDGDLVTLHGDVELDLGGIAKGWIADRACDLLRQTGAALVSAGGDIACSPRADDQPWAIAVEGLDGLVLDLGSGGIATSGTGARRWRDAAGAVHHHVIDPATGRSATTDVLAVTVVAADCAAAEVQATALLLAGVHDAVEEAEALGIPALLLLEHGELVRTGPLA